MKDNQRKPVPSAFWPVTFPLLVGAVLVIALLVWAASASAGGTDLSRFADLSTALLMILMMALSVVPLLILVGIAFGLFRLYQVIPRGTRWLHQILKQVQEIVKKASSVITEPVIRIESTAAGIKEPFPRKSRETRGSFYGERFEIHVKKGDQDD